MKPRATNSYAYIVHCTCTSNKSRGARRLYWRRERKSNERYHQGKIKEVGGIYVDTRCNLFRLRNKSSVFFASRRFYFLTFHRSAQFDPSLLRWKHVPISRGSRPFKQTTKTSRYPTAQKSAPAPPQLTTLVLTSQHTSLPPSSSSSFSKTSIMAGRPAPEQPPFPWRSDMLAGKKAIVTGGSAGIGAAITEALVSVCLLPLLCTAYFGTVWASS